MRFTLRHAVLLILGAWLLVSLLPLGARPLIAPDETRYGLIGWEMAHSGEWFHLRMDGFRYYEKPPLVYWMTAAAIKAFGLNAFAIRLPASLAALAWSLSAAWLAWRWRRDAVVAAVAGLAALTMILTAILSTVAVLDGPFSAFVAASILLLAIATESGGGRRIAWALAAGGAAGLALLSKGLLAVAIPAMVLGPWLALRREWKALAILPAVAIAGLLVVTLPLALPLHQAEPHFWHEFFWMEHVRRFLDPDPNQHPEPWWYFLVLLPVMCFPWVLTAPAALRSIASRVRQDPWMLLCACWIVMPLAFFSLASGKLPTYLLPTAPALAAVFAVGLDDWSRSTRGGAPRGARRSGAALPLLLIGAAAGAVLLSGAGGWPASRIWLDDPAWRALLVMAVFLAWAALEWIAKQQQERAPMLLWGALGALPLAASYPLLLPDGLLSQSKAPMRHLQPVEASLRCADTVLADTGWAHAAALAGRRSDVLVLGGPGEFDNELGDPAEQARLIPWEALPDWVQREVPTGTVTLVILDPRRDVALDSLDGAQRIIDEPGLRVIALPAR